jgi:UDP-N-acetylglucosamine--N-acetylmuramyl-(pentapeptide) pyrophosphoryl-undecaprenol N-acetylglucosamine transferase
MDADATFIFAGGGSGGHLFPGIAVAEELVKRLPNSRVVFVGSNRDIELKIASQYKLDHQVLPVQPLPMLKRNPFRFVWENWRAWRAAQEIVKSLKPRAIVGLGGFASAPIVWAARRYGIPIVLLEQNVIPGRTTRWLARYADRVCVSFKETCDRMKIGDRAIMTGNPVRHEIAFLSKLNSNQSRVERTLLVLGGSQGADSLNDAVVSAIRTIAADLSGWQIVHQTGPRHCDEIRQKYQDLGLAAEVAPFFDDMTARYAAASLAVSRAGATTLAELACAAVPMVLMPYPHAADDHQRFNARVFSDHNAAVVVEHHADSKLTAEPLSEQLRNLISDYQRRGSMRQQAAQLAIPDAADRVVDVIFSLLR